MPWARRLRCTALLASLRAPLRSRESGMPGLGPFGDACRRFPYEPAANLPLQVAIVIALTTV